MSKPGILPSSICHACRQRLLPLITRRSFRTTTLLRADPKPDNITAGLGALSKNITSNQSRRQQTSSNINTSNSGSSFQNIFNDSTAINNYSSIFSDAASENLNSSVAQKPHRLHVYSTKHNTHLTFVQPPRPASLTNSSAGSAGSSSASSQKKLVDVLLSVSAGNIGFRKAGRGSYDAAYQLAAFALGQIKEKGMLKGCTGIEVVLRGFGAGREAVTKALLGSEGRFVRGRIVGVVDATRLKLGGPRSKKPRRLG